MPYLQHWNLPESVREHLDEEGQKAFQRAHNRAFREHHNEVSAMRSAWQSVEQAGHLERNDRY